MNVSVLFPSKYVKAGDLGGRNITVEISHLTIEKIGAPPAIEDKPILYFRNAKKGMVLNRTNGMTIAALYGPETDNWTGHRITLFSTRVQAFGGVHEVIRIQPQVPPAPKGGQPVEETHFADAEDMPEGDEIDDTATPVEPEQPQAHRKIGYITDKMTNELHALITTLHGKDANNARHLLVKDATDGKHTSSKDLTQAQANSLIARLHLRLSKNIETAADALNVDLNAILLAHNVASLEDANPVTLTHVWKAVDAATQPVAEAA